MAASLLIMPAYIKYFDNQTVLGLWFTIISVLTWILTFDLGIGNGLRNNLVNAISKNDREKIKHYISSAYIVIAIIVIIAYLISTFIFPIINWNTVFNITNDIISKDVLLKAIQIVFVGIMLQFFLKLITSILYALQKSAIPNLLTLCTTIIQLLYVIFAKSYSIEDNLLNLANVYILAVNIPLAIATVLIFTTRLKDCKPNIKFFRVDYAKKVMKLGGYFFFVQIMYMMLMNTNEFIITWFYGSDKVVEYQVYYKLFIFIGLIFNLALTPIWSAVTKAFSEKKFKWIKDLYKLLKKVSIIGIICEFIFIFVFQFAVNIWLKENAICVNYLYAFIFAVFGSVFIYNAVLCSVANGLGKLKTQLIFYTIGAIVKIPMIFLLNIIYNDWIVVIIVNSIILLLFCIIQNINLNKYLNKYKEEKTNV